MRFAESPAMQARGLAVARMCWLYYPYELMTLLPQKTRKFLSLRGEVTAYRDPKRHIARPVPFGEDGNFMHEVRTGR